MGVRRKRREGDGVTCLLLERDCAEHEGCCAEVRLVGEGGEANEGSQSSSSSAVRDGGSSGRGWMWTWLRGEDGIMLLITTGDRSRLR
jgi:hypothetical protein